jgi:hypothetical protein
MTCTLCDLRDVTATLPCLEAQLQARLGGQVRGLRLELQEGRVVLHGQCRTYYAKQLAQHAVMDATALPIAANAIEVV